MHKALATLIVLILGLKLVAGPHPYCLRQAESIQHEAASCHGKGSGMAMDPRGPHRGHTSSPTKGLPVPDHDAGHGPTNGCDILCQHACQMTAIAAAQPVAFSVAPVARSFVEVSDSDLPLLPRLFDHVPLA